VGILTTLLKTGNKRLKKSKNTQKEPLAKYTHSEMFTTLFENHPDAIFTIDLDGHFLSTNHGVESFIGYQANELQGSFAPLVKKEHLEQVMEHFQLALKGIPQNYNCEVVHKDGHFVQLNITNLPFKVNGEIIGIYGFAKDLTNLYQKEDELVKIKNSLYLAQQVATIGSWDYDVQKDYVYCSEPLYEILGIPMTESTTATNYQNLLQMIIPEDREFFDYHFQNTKKSGSTMDVNYRIRRLDNSIITVHVRAQAIKDKNGKVNRIIGVLQDVSAQVLTENKLKESEEKFEHIVKNLDVGIWSMDFSSKKIVYASPGLEKLSGYSVHEFLSSNKNWKELIHPDDRNSYNQTKDDLMLGKMVQHQYRIMDAFGTEKWIEDKVFPIVNSEGDLIRLDGIVQDITDRKRSEEKMNFFAFHDYLTELPNRRMFDIKLEQSIAENQISENQFALMYLDLDRFKFVNDTLGHGIGDELLRQVSKRLSSFRMDGDCLFRIGGDEFTIILNKLSPLKDSVAIGKAIIKAIEQPFHIEGYDINITTSIGIGIFPHDGDTLKELKLNTDAALYRAKELGKNNVQLFTKTLNIESYKLFTLETDLRKAIQRDEFILHYQPRVDTFSGEIVGAEALIRWNHPKWGMVSPIEFIPLAEETGLINEIGDWVIQQVCKQLKDWKQKGCNLVPISINLSAKTLMRADLVPTIIKHVTKSEINPSLIEIEITENSIIQNETSVLSTIELLKDMGISISLDDFGTGYSSIGYLKKFNVDYIKIDRSYIKDIIENPGDSTIVQSIILLAKGFQLKVVAEGVETKEQWEVLKGLGCHFIQGYLFSKPIAAADFAQLIVTHNHNIFPFPKIQNLYVKNRRRNHRVEFTSPLVAEMTITSIKGEPLVIGNTKVEILNIGHDGLSFASKLHLPVTDEVTLQFEIKAFGESLKLGGHTIWKREKEDNDFYYGVKFKLEDCIKKQLTTKIKEIENRLAF
jgi:diguanylate cyclase (GGDEF)-like protein/PAS domain S-box-containing protein